jgi:hypothetical protein
MASDHVVYRVSAAHAYDNWRYDFDSLADALVMVQGDTSTSIHDLTAFVNGRIKSRHGIWRGGKRYESIMEAISGSVAAPLCAMHIPTPPNAE